MREIQLYPLASRSRGEVWIRDSDSDPMNIYKYMNIYFECGTKILYV